MSQAVSAPIIGASSNAPDKIDKNIGRRALLTGLAVAPAALALPAVAASMEEDEVTRSLRVDAKFWAETERYRRLSDQFDTYPCATFAQERERDAKVGDAMHAAMVAMGGTGVHTLLALSTKMQAFREFPECDVCGGQFTAFEVMLFDMERIMKAEYRA